MRSADVIRLENVTKVYYVGEHPFHALRGVTLSVGEGDFIAIMGPSGSGKTTLLNIMGLLDRPTSGRVLVEGIDISGLNGLQLARLRNLKIGFVFQFFNLVNRLTVLENIEMPLVARGMPKNERLRAVKEALVKVGGDLSWLNKRPSQLSGGQQQRVAIARAIVGRPKVILADEPTGNLDRNSAKTVVNVFLDLNKLGHTIVVVTHDPEVAHCARKIYNLRDGRITGILEPDPGKCITSTI